MWNENGKSRWRWSGKERKLRIGSWLIDFLPHIRLFSAAAMLVVLERELLSQILSYSHGAKRCFRLISEVKFIPFRVCAPCAVFLFPSRPRHFDCK